MGKLTLAGLDGLATRFQDDAACDVVLATLPEAGATDAERQRQRTLLRALVQAEQRLLQAELEVGQVADILRRDQKFSPPGRPSINIVQLRKQQAVTRQTALVARQGLAQAAQTFVQATGLVLRVKQTPSEAATIWVQKLG